MLDGPNHCGQVILSKHEVAMNRRDLLLCILAAADGNFYTPVQIQKAAFLITRNVPSLVQDGEPYNFVPYDYGPFDRDVYSDASQLSLMDEAIIAPSASGRWQTYAASERGRSRGQALLNGIPPDHKRYILDVSTWVRAQPFGSLVKAIYDQYPEMKQNSIFQG